MNWEMLLSSEILVSFFTLAALEIVLGIDNIIFISILAGKLPPEQREKARKLGLLGALLTRLALLSVVAWIVKLDTPFAEVFGVALSGKSIILIIGGLFLLYKATKEIHHKVEGPEDNPGKAIVVATFAGVITQIMLLDVVFSIDSVITAVGMTQSLSVMVAANIIALVVMLISGKFIGDYVDRHPTIKVLALSFLLMVGLVLIAEGVGFHIPKGYIYFAMGFSIFVEVINLRVAKKSAIKSKL